MFSLKGKRAVVTGAGVNSMGHGIALSLAEQGADVAVCNLPKYMGTMGTVVDEIKAFGVKAIGVAADATKREEISLLFDKAEEAFGGCIDIVVAAVGGDPGQWADKSSTSKSEPKYGKMEPLKQVKVPSMLDISFEQHNAVTSLTQYTTWHTLQEGATRLVEKGQKGSLIIIGSVMADMAAPGASSYSAAKASIRQLGRTLANELGSYGVRVNTIQPGHMLTSVELAALTDEQIANRSNNIPIGRMGTNRDIGNAAAFLSSDAAAYITGSTLNVDGGWATACTMPVVPPNND
eukprot:m.264835 g.264835  ORF g.264835 m.264835 type:complete len:292 (-) comp16233_c0_seq26:212-1087(-)